MIERVTYTTQPSAQSMGRYITVYAPDGSYVSRHINMEECTESALAHAQANEISGTYRFVPPEKHMSVQIIKTVPGVYTGSFIATPSAGRIQAVGYAGAFNNDNPQGQNNAQRIATILAGRSPHFAYNTPADPITTGDVTVTNAADFNFYASAATGGSTIIRINSSFSGNITITASDVDIIMSNSATITGTLTLGSGGNRASRIRWTGGNVTGRFTGINYQDVLFDDWYNATPVSADWTAAVEQIQRAAVLNSTLEYTGGGTGASYHVYIGPVDNVIPVPSTFHQDLIFANAKIIGNGGHTARIMGVQRILMVDSVWNPDGASAFAGLRFHYSCSDIWARDTWVRDGFKIDAVNASDPGPSFTNALFDNFDRYADDAYSIGLWAFNGSGGSWVNSNTGTVQNSTLYNSAGSGTVGFTGYTNGGGNSNSTWDGSTVPDYSAIGAIR